MRGRSTHLLRATGHTGGGSDGRERRPPLRGAPIEALEQRVMLATGGGGLPRVVAVRYDADMPLVGEPGRHLRVQFSGNVGGSLALENFSVRNVTSHQDLARSSLAYDVGTDTAVIGLGWGAVPDGNYTLTLTAAGVSDADGNALDGDGNGTAGGDFRFSFYELAGDANRDRTVNFSDLAALAQNYNQTGKTWAKGDFTADARVNFSDLAILAQRYNRGVRAPVRLTSPLAGGQALGSVTLSADVAGEQGVAGVQFLVNGAPVGAEVTAAPYSLAWDSRTVANGAYRITAVARDSAGDLSVSNSADVVVNNPDVVAPTVAVESPAGDAALAGVVPFSASAADNVGVVGVQFLVDGVVTGAEDTEAPYAMAWDSRAVPDGPHTITARARDAAGNVTTSAGVSVSVSNYPVESVSGQWSGVMDWPLVAINTVLLKDGRVLMWDGDGTGDVCIGPTSARVWDPATGQFTPVPIPYFTGHEDDIFCSAQALLADGRVLVVGGHDCDGPGLGISKTNIFDPATMTWTPGPEMHYRRWYPTATTLADGRVLVLGGSVETTIDYVSIPEVYDPVTNTFTELDAAELTIPSYSFVFQNPDGRVIVTGSDESTMPTYALDVDAQTWTTVDPTVLDAGSGVMYRPGKFLKAGSSYLSAPPDNGGDLPSAATTYVLDTTQGSPAWQQVGSLANARTHLNLTLLPDGSVLATGGSQDIGGLTPERAVYPAEVWSPTTQTWTTMASMATPRMYHSTATLLPDGRVLIAGGGRLGPVSFPSAEIYSPTYLFKGTRPVVTAAPSALDYGSSFFVGTPDASRIASVALIRNGSATHSFNMDQRFIPLTFEATAGGLTVQAPADGDLAPPGYYMLFIVNADGVPSVAPFVRLPAPYEDKQPPTAPTSLAATGGSGFASLTWAAATDNVGVAKYNVYRSATSDFVPGPENWVGSTPSTSYTDASVSAGTYYYLVRAVDAGGNTGPASNQASAAVTADTTPPVVSVGQPDSGATVQGAVTFEAQASDDVGVAGVRFLLNGEQVGAEVTAVPYTIRWNSRSVANGTYTLTAVTRDLAGNTTTSAGVTITVANPADGLVASYSFDTGSGSVATDSSGNGFDGTISGATWSTSGKFGNALSFDGINDIVDIAGADALDLTTGMTLEAWVRPSALGGYRTVLMKDVPGELGYALYAGGDVDRPNAWARIDGTSYDASGTAALPLNTWSHLAATYDGTALRLYVNGVQVGIRSVSGELEASADPLHIGGNAIWGEYFAGLIDEVRVYNCALTATQIQADMNAPLNGDAVPATTAALASRLRPSIRTVSAFNTVRAIT